MRDYISTQKRFARIASEDMASRDRTQDVRPQYYTSMLERMAMDVTKGHAPIHCDKALIQCLLEQIGAYGDPCTQLLIRGKTAWEPEDPGISVRRFGDRLIVTQVRKDTRFAVGDVITKVQNNPIPEYHKQVWRTLRSKIQENEDWRIALQFSATVHVLRSGEEVRLPLMRFGREKEELRNSISFEDGICMLSLETLDDRDGIAQLLARHADEIRESRGMILDLRRCISSCGDCDALLPLLADAPKKRSELVGDEGVYILYSPGNKRLFEAELTAMLNAAADEEMRGEIRHMLDEMAQKSGWVFEPSEEADDDVVQPLGAPALAILTDRETGPDAEMFVEACRRLGRAAVIGRNTMGALDCVRPVLCPLDDSLSLVYSTGLRPAAYRGEKISGTGLAPDVHIPWTPELLERDLDKMAAKECL